ncbi:MAG TPA: hypothetical protein VNZ26_00505, partial [Vicinamibacterales bacterium]|nr:hypothetical protein [Vicinamibacterales bacterium]
SDGVTDPRELAITVTWFTPVRLGRQSYRTVKIEAQPVQAKEAFALWATRRDPEHVADPDRLVEDAPPVRPGKTRTVRRRGGVVLSVKRILRDYEDAGSVNRLISLWGFVDVL